MMGRGKAMAAWGKRAAEGGEPSSIRPYFEALLLLLLAAGFFTLVGTGRLERPVVLLGTLALALRVILPAAGIRPRLSSSFTNVVSVLYLVFYPIDVYYLSGGFLPATVHLVLLVAVVKLFSASRPRDYAYLCVLAFLEVLAAATLTVGSVFLLYFTVFLVLTVATVISYEVFRAESAAPARGEWAEPGVSRRRTPSLRRALFGISVAAAGCVAVCAAGLFFLLPRFAFGYWNPNPGVRRLTGFSDDVRLGEIGELQRSNAPVMHLRVEESLPPEPPGSFVWRLQGRVLTEFDGRNWYDPDRPRVAPTEFGRLPLPPPVKTWNYVHRFVRYSVALEPVGADVLFVAPRVRDLQSRLPNVAWDATGTLMPLGRGFGGLAYSVLSDLGEPSDRQLLAAGRHEPPQIASQYLELPPNLDPRIPALARAIVGRRKAPIAQMRALEAYLRTHYRYTLDQRASGSDPLADFLFRVRAGHCEYFASALAVMGRALGIPTRVVNGFVGGQYNEFSGEYVFRGRDAHSWVQAYFPAPGGGGLWLPFDGTAGDADGTPAWSRAAMYWDAMQSFWQEWVINYDFFHQMRLAQTARAAISGQARTWAGWLTTATDRLIAAMRKPFAALAAGAGEPGDGWLAWLLALAAGTALVWVLRRQWTIAPAHAGRHRLAEATRYYRRLQRQLRRRGVRPEAALTPEELIAAVPERVRASAHEALSRFVADYQRARFGGDNAGLARLPEDLRSVRRQLRQAAARS